MCRQEKYYSRDDQDIVGISQRSFHHADLCSGQVPGGVPDQENAKAKKKTY